MFAYRLVSGHARVQIGLAGIGGEGTVTAATFILQAAVTVWEQRRAERVDVACLAMHVHVGRMRGKGGDGRIGVEGEEDAPPPHPPPPRVAKRKAPPLLPHTQVRPPPRPPVQAPPRSGRHVSGRGECGCMCGASAAIAPDVAGPCERR